MNQCMIIFNSTDIEYKNKYQNFKYNITLSLWSETRVQVYVPILEI